MSYDIKFLTGCDHTVNGKTYREDMCPKCYGKNYYLDIAFDGSGEIITTNNEIKLQQELLKVLLDDKLSDLFFPMWGSEINMFIGKKKTTANKSRLEMVIRRAVERLKKIQENEALHNSSINDKEQIQKIEYIGLEPMSATEWRCKIVLSNIAGTLLSQTFTL